MLPIRLSIQLDYPPLLYQLDFMRILRYTYDLLDSAQHWTTPDSIYVT